MGYAEIMQNGIAKPEDTKKFTGLIYTEAKRLLNLIEDIIKLSRLEETAAGAMREKFEQIDVRQICDAVRAGLEMKAKNLDVQFSVKYPEQEIFLPGIRQTLYEMIYNLCDNAVSYNKPGGTVQLAVRIDDTNGHTVIAVADTGIGIAPEHHARIFERFYRVDKSHSRTTGGTGLGLSIVKHGAQLMNASIALESQPNVGTTITLTF
jgi:two-component system phosphate regulon sensor histidine kinase PhoR